MVYNPSGRYSYRSMLIARGCYAGVLSNSLYDTYRCPLKKGQIGPLAGPGP